MNAEDLVQHKKQLLTQELTSLLTDPARQGIYSGSQLMQMLRTRGVELPADRHEAHELVSDLRCEIEVARYEKLKEQFYQQHLKPATIAVLKNTEKDLDDNDLVIIHLSALNELGMPATYPITVEGMHRLRAEIEQERARKDQFIQRRQQLLRSLAETQAALEVPDGPHDDGLWRLGSHDTVNGLRAQVTLMDQILANPDQQTDAGLTVILRSLFAQCDEIDRQINALPNFDHVGEGEEVEVEDLPEDEREVYDQVMALYHESFVNQHQYRLVGNLLNIDPCRIHDVACILGAYHESPHSTQREKQATYYPMIKAWIDNGGDVMALDIPEEFSNWMRKPESVSR